MTVPPEVLEELRQIGLSRRRLNADEWRRHQLAPYLDTANMSAADVLQAYAALRAGMDTPVVSEAR